MDADAGTPEFEVAMMVQKTPPHYLLVPIDSAHPLAQPVGDVKCASNLWRWHDRDVTPDAR